MRVVNTTAEKPPIRVTRSASTPSLALVFSGGACLLPPQRYSVGREGLLIGREVKQGVGLPEDPQASRKHASVHRSPAGELRLVDEGSRNGTRLNGQRVTEAVLEDGDVISVGSSFLVVSLEPKGLVDAQVPELLGTSVTARRLRTLCSQVAPSDATVLLLGESGCGKEVAARAVHALSGRSGPFVAVNCGAIPETLAESLLFGNLAGVFTGAVTRPGLFRAAEGGTLFLDEVGELPMSLQPKLLRVLQDRAVLAVGSAMPHPCDVRVVAATNRDLKTSVAGQTFRGDLYARLAEFPVHLPPLRKRREDVLGLLVHALGSPGAPPAALEAELVERLLLYSWPYNVREVLTVAKQLRIRAGAGPYRLEEAEDSLPLPSTPCCEPPSLQAEAGGGEEREPPPNRAQLEELLRLHRGVVADVARAMSRSRKQVYRWLRHHGLEVDAFRPESH